MDNSELKDFLEQKYLQYCQTEFIETDPVQIPHLFERKEDIEIAGFLTSIISWGNRTAIIKSAKRQMQLMDNAPFDFICNSTQNDLKKLINFVYRTFNDTDLLFFVSSLQNIYKNHGGLQSLFENAYRKTQSIKETLIYFRKVFFEIEYPERTQKHIANVEKKSSAKRLNMFLRWMVRSNTENVDFGIWKNIPSTALYLPLDVHTGTVGRQLGLLSRKQNDWKAVEEITSQLRKFDPNDPIKYDFALFGIGVFEKL